MTEDIFIDGAGEVGVQGAIVRVNLVVASATEKDDKGVPVRDVRHRLLMTPQAATELHGRLEAALRRLAEAGVVTRNEPKATDD